MDREENMRGMAEAEASALDELITRRLEPVLRRLDAIESRLGQTAWPPATTRLNSASIGLRGTEPYCPGCLEPFGVTLAAPHPQQLPVPP
jgi:hypothetical protein